MNDLAISRGGPISDATCYFDYKDLDAAQRKGARDSQPNNARANYNGLSLVRPWDVCSRRSTLELKADIHC